MAANRSAVHYTSVQANNVRFQYKYNTTLLCSLTVGSHAVSHTLLTSWTSYTHDSYSTSAPLYKSRTRNFSFFCMQRHDNASGNNDARIIHRTCNQCRAFYLLLRQQFPRFIQIIRLYFTLFWFVMNTLSLFRFRSF